MGVCVDQDGPTSSEGFKSLGANSSSDDHQSVSKCSQDMYNFIFYSECVGKAYICISYLYVALIKYQDQKSDIWK